MTDNKNNPPTPKKNRDFFDILASPKPKKIRDVNKDKEDSFEK